MRRRVRLEPRLPGNWYWAVEWCTSEENDRWEVEANDFALTLTEARNRAAQRLVHLSSPEIIIPQEEIFEEFGAADDA
jgi:hypothetical protein